MKRKNEITVIWMGWRFRFHIDHYMYEGLHRRKLYCGWFMVAIYEVANND